MQMKHKKVPASKSYHIIPFWCFAFMGLHAVCLPAFFILLQKALSSLIIFIVSHHFNLLCFSFNWLSPSNKLDSCRTEPCLLCLCLLRLFHKYAYSSQIIYNFHKPLKSLTIFLYMLLISPQIAFSRIYILNRNFCLN